MLPTCYRIKILIDRLTISLIHYLQSAAISAVKHLFSKNSGKFLLLSSFSLSRNTEKPKIVFFCCLL
jgi:hypothetical protein